LLIAQADMIITTHFGDRLDLTDHVDQMIRLGDQDFRTIENTAFLSRLGQCIAMAAGTNAPHAILIRLRGKMSEELWSYVGDLWAEASEYRHIGKDGRPSFRPPEAQAS
jgi:hypothetical protein